MQTCHPISTDIASQWHLVGRITLVRRNTFVQRSYARGRCWLRLCLRDSGSWDVQAFKTRDAAVRGDFGDERTMGVAFEYGGPSVWRA